MSAGLADAIEHLLIAIEETQRRLAVVYQEKRQAIRQANASELDRLTEMERLLVKELQVHLRDRERILQRSRSALCQADSLTSVVRSLTAAERARLMPLIERTRLTAEENRRESWIIWIVSKHSLRLFAQIRELIANGGRKVPVYSARSDSEITGGGAILDASA